jgi:hypothetical protein
MLNADSILGDYFQQYHRYSRYCHLLMVIEKPVVQTVEAKARRHVFWTNQSLGLRAFSEHLLH